MIDLLITNNVVTGVLTVKDNSTSISGFTEGKVIAKKLGFEKLLNGSSTPTLVDFLNPSLNSLITVPSADDDIIDVEYLLLKPLTGVTSQNGSNKLDKTGLYNEAQSFSYVYSNDKLYEIDKAASIPNTLYLKTPLEGSTTLYLALYKAECVVSMYNIPKLLKALCLTQGDCGCKTCGDAQAKIKSAFLYLDALEVTTDLDCEERRKFMKCLKDLFNLC